MIYNSELNILKYLESAIKYDEFEYLYQPIYDISQDKYTKFEVLTRLKNKQINTELFISIAEKYNLIHKLDLLALKNACKSIKMLNSNGIIIERAYINFSPSTLERKNFFYELKDILNYFDIDGKSIGIEITEFTEIQDTNKLNKVIKEISNIGVEILMDDFGGSNSNIQRLIDIKFNSIKIDKSLVSKISYTNNSKVIFKMLKVLGNELGVSLIAEGIENQQEFDFLKKCGINYFQGYYLSIPIRKEEIISLLS